MNVLLGGEDVYIISRLEAIHWRPKDKFIHFSRKEDIRLFVVHLHNFQKGGKWQFSGFEKNPSRGCDQRDSVSKNSQKRWHKSCLLKICPTGKDPMAKCPRCGHLAVFYINNAIKGMRLERHLVKSRRADDSWHLIRCQF